MYYPTYYQFWYDYAMHTSHQHRYYYHSCDDYEALLERHENSCGICRRSGVKLNFDHDHTMWVTTGEMVRGLLCTKCNSLMRYVDGGYPGYADTRTDAYIAAYEARKASRAAV